MDAEMEQWHFCRHRMQALFNEWLNTWIMKGSQNGVGDEFPITVRMQEVVRQLFDLDLVKWKSNGRRLIDTCHMRKWIAVILIIFESPWTVASQTPLSMEFSRQEYWSGGPFPSSRGLPDAEIKPVSPALQADSLPPEPPGEFHGALWAMVHEVAKSQTWLSN